MTPTDTYPRAGVWIERVRLGAELAIAIGGATLAVLATWQQLHELEMARNELLQDRLEPHEEGGKDGAR